MRHLTLFTRLQNGHLIGYRAQQRAQIGGACAQIGISDNQEKERVREMGYNNPVI